MSKFFIYYSLASSASYLVDDYPSIFVAFAPIRLNSSTTNSIRVRRSSDNAEQDFTPEEVTDGTLTTWTGANDGFVVTAYNQGSSGSSYDITQGNSGLQPKIVSAGVLETKNSVVTFNFKANDILSNTTTVTEFATGQDFSVIFGSAPQSTATLFTIQDRPVVSYHDPRVSPNRHVFQNSTWFDLSTAYNNTNMRLLSYELSSSGTDRIDTFDNSNTGGAGTIGTYGTPTVGVKLMSSSYGSYHSIYLAVNNVTDRSAIETEVNNIYSIYGLYLVDDYAPIGAWATSKISSTATNCLRVRRSSDNAEQDIGFVGNDLDTASLLSFVGANDGYVTKFYNQGTGGATYDVIQATTANQPFIVSGGTITTDSNTGAVSLFSNNTSRYLATSGTISIDDSSMVSVHNPSTGSGAMGAICAGEGATGKRRSLAQFTSGTLQMFASGYSANLSLGSVSATNTYLSHGTFDNVNNVIYGSLNGSTTSGSITLNTPVAKKISLMSTHEDGDAFPEGLQGFLTMAMIWDTQNESNMANVVADINNIYSIY